MVSGLAIPLVRVVISSYWFPLEISIDSARFGIRSMRVTRLGKALTTLGTVSTKALSKFGWIMALMSRISISKIPRWHSL